MPNQVLERAFARMDGLKALWVRYKFTIRNWLTLNIMALDAYFINLINNAILFQIITM